MAEYVSFDTSDESFSRFIAEALIAQEQTSREIFDQGEQLGTFAGCVQRCITACAQTACDPTDKVQSVAFSARK